MTPQKFWKMSGSGNDFVFVDGRGHTELVARWSDPEFVRTVCAAHTGVGADGIGILEVSATEDFRLSYFNRDGSRGELCGNASLCATRLAAELGIGPEVRSGVAPGSDLRFETDAGVITARIRDGAPEIDLGAPRDLDRDSAISRRDGELRLGYVNTGVPHLVLRTADVASAPVLDRGPELRYHASLAAGANVNWVSPAAAGGWSMRTYERGVEAETLACGTGAVACAVLLQAWGETESLTRLWTRSGKVLAVTTRSEGGSLIPSLSGEGRIVFEGFLREL